MIDEMSSLRKQLFAKDDSISELQIKIAGLEGVLSQLRVDREGLLISSQKSKDEALRY